MSKRRPWLVVVVVGLWLVGLGAYVLGALIGDPLPVWPDGKPPTTPARDLELAVGEVLMDVGLVSLLLAVPATIVLAVRRAGR